MSKYNVVSYPMYQNDNRGFKNRSPTLSFIEYKEINKNILKCGENVIKLKATHKDTDFNTKQKQESSFSKFRGMVVKAQVS